jgi:NusA-like KH domain protein
MKLTMENIMFMQALERISGVSAKDCLVNGNLISFLVKEEDMGKAIGKAAGNVRELEARLKRKIELVGYFAKPEDTLAGAFEVKVESVKNNPDTIILTMSGDGKRKVLSNIGRFKRIQELIKRNYGMNVAIN